MKPSNSPQFALIQIKFILLKKLFGYLMLASILNACDKSEISLDSYHDEEVFLTDSTYDYSFIEGTDSILTERNYFSYNLNGNVLENNIYDSENNHTRIVSEYDDSENLIKKSSLIWDQTVQQWFIESEDVMTYNKTNLMESKTSTIYDVQSGNVSEKTKVENVFDPNGYKLGQYTYNWDFDNGDWVYSNKTEYENDENGNAIIEKKYTYDIDGNSWKQSFVYYCSYNENNRILQRKFNSTSPDGTIENNTIDYTYDANDNLLSEQRNYGSKIIKFEYSYDNLNNLILYRYYGNSQLFTTLHLYEEWQWSRKGDQSQVYCLMKRSNNAGLVPVGSYLRFQSKHMIKTKVEMVRKNKLGIDFLYSDLNHNVQ